jgi:hypothetical protein
MAVQEFMDALKLEIFAQYNAARTDPRGYAKTAGLPPRAIELLQQVSPVPAFGAVSVELSEKAMNKVRAGRALRRPGEAAVVSQLPAVRASRWISTFRETRPPASPANNPPLAVQACLTLPLSSLDCPIR